MFTLVKAFECQNQYKNVYLIFPLDLFCCDWRIFFPFLLVSFSFWVWPCHWRSIFNKLWELHEQRERETGTWGKHLQMKSFWQLYPRRLMLISILLKIQTSDIRVEGMRNEIYWINKNTKRSLSKKHVSILSCSISIYQKQKIIFQKTWQRRRLQIL